MPNTNPVTAWKALKEGNERFVAGKPEHPSQSVDASRQPGRGAEADRGHLRLRRQPGGRRADLRPGPGRHVRGTHRRAGHRLGGAGLHRVRGDGPQRAAHRRPRPRQLRRRQGRADARSTTATIPGGFVRDVVERVAPSILLGRRDGLTRVDEFEARHVRETRGAARWRVRRRSRSGWTRAPWPSWASPTSSPTGGRCCVDHVGDIGDLGSISRAPVTRLCPLLRGSQLTGDTPRRVERVGVTWAYGVNVLDLEPRGPLPTEIYWRRRGLASASRSSWSGSRSRSSSPS